MKSSMEYGTNNFTRVQEFAFFIEKKDRLMKTCLKMCIDKNCVFNDPNYFFVISQDTITRDCAKIINQLILGSCKKFI